MECACNELILVHTVNSLLQLVQNVSRRILTTTRLQVLHANLLHMQYTALVTTFIRWQFTMRRMDVDQLHSR